MSTENPTERKSDSKRTEEKPVKRHPPTKWNIMFYVAGDSMLSAPMVSQLKQITDAGFQRDARVMVFFDPNCNGREARVFNVNNRRKKWKTEKFNKPTIIGDGRDSYVRNIAEDCKVAGLPQVPAALSLLYFLERTRHQFPAENYMVFLLGHGVIVGNDAFLPNEDDDSAITLAQLSWILNKFAANAKKEGSKFPLVGFHSCSMSSVELAYELKGTADYMIGTQGAAFPNSWPYRQLLKRIFSILEEPYEKEKQKARKNREGVGGGTTNDRPDNDTADPVKTILTAIQDLSFYNAVDFWFAGYSADLSLCSLEPKKVGRLTEPLTALARALKQGLENPETRQSIVMAHSDSQSYWGEAYSDLYDLCERLSDYCGEGSDIWKSAQAIMDQLSTKPRNPNFRILGDFERLVVYSDYYGPMYQHSHGLSIYFPWTLPETVVSANYQNYSFTNDWGDDSWWSFLMAYFNKTRRPLPDGQELENDEVEPAASTPPKPPSSGLEAITDDQILKWVSESSSEPPKISFPPQAPTLAPGSGPPKPPTVGPGPPKPPFSGLFGATVIKNFAWPKKFTITSRPWSRHGKFQDEEPEDET